MFGPALQFLASNSGRALLPSKDVTMSLRAGSVCFRCCLRTATIGQSSGWVSPSLTQVRGKKKLAKATSIAVRLREDIPGFGRKGR